MRLQNRGRLLAAGLLFCGLYHHEDKPGHIAIVRPSDKDIGALREDGPQITQAGAINFRSVSLREGCGGHPAAWRDQEVRYYAHPVGYS